MFVIDTQSKLPIFEQLKKQILEFITIGILSPTRLPKPIRSWRSMDIFIRRKERDALWQTMNPIS